MNNFKYNHVFIYLLIFNSVQYKKQLKLTKMLRKWLLMIYDTEGLN